MRELRALTGADSERKLASIVLDEDTVSPGTQLYPVRPTAPGAVGESADGPTAPDGDDVEVLRVCRGDTA